MGSHTCVRNENVESRQSRRMGMGSHMMLKVDDELAGIEHFP